jgi:hypothetical protein
VTFLGSRVATGRLDSTNINPYGNGLWRVVFDQRVLAIATNAIEVYHISLTGPAGSTLQMFIDRTFYDTTPRGDLNSYDPTNPLILRGGQELNFFWNSSATPVPSVTIWIRTASVY